MKTSLSPSVLSVFRECHKCFWLQCNHGINRPRGVFPSLPGGMDRILKNWYDSHREKGILPQEVKNAISGITGLKLYADKARLDRMRNWRQGLSCTIGSMDLKGAIDELLVDDDIVHYPLDYKTRGSAPKDGQSEIYYGNQLNCYALMLRETGFKVGNRGFLAYYFPQIINLSNSLGTEVVFNCQVVELEVSAEAARENFIKAVECLAGPMPISSDDCEYCKNFNDLDAFHNLKRTAGGVAA